MYQTAKYEAISMLAEVMGKARDENPRGDLYRKISNEKLFLMFKQNVEELEIALRYDNDVQDKLADCANYLSFILHNTVDVPQQ